MKSFFIVFCLQFLLIFAKSQEYRVLAPCNPIRHIFQIIFCCFKKYIYFCKGFYTGFIMEENKDKKIKYEQALARWKRSIQIKREAEKRMAEEWKRRGITGTIVSL